MICKQQRAAVCGSHVLFNTELLREKTSQAWMGLSQQSAKKGRGRWGANNRERNKMNFSPLL